MYRRNASSWLKHLDFLLLDIICMEAAFFSVFSFGTVRY